MNKKRTIQIKRKKNIVYNWDNDLIKRKNTAMWIINSIKNIEQSFNINLNMRYGDGKTFFLKSTQNYIKKYNIKADYISLSDYIVSNTNILIVLYKMLKNQFYSDENKHSFIKLNKAIGLLRIIEEKSYKDNDIFLKIVENDNFNINDYLDNSKSDSLNMFMKLEKLKEDLIQIIKSELQNIIDSKNEENNLKFLYLIDDLDLCSPKYIMSFFEIIKNYFNVPGIVFLIAFNESEIQNRFTQLYGINSNVKGILDRFIDWKIDIQYNTKLINFITKLNTQLNTRLDFVNINAASRIMINFSFTLRETEKCLIDYYSILENWLDYENDELFEDEDIWTIFFMYALKIKKPLQYKAIKNWEYSYQDIKNMLLLCLPNQEDELYRNTITAILCLDFTNEIKQYIQQYALNQNKEFNYWKTILNVINNIEKEERFKIFKEKKINTRAFINEIIKYIEFTKR